MRKDTTATIRISRAQVLAAYLLVPAVLLGWAYFSTPLIDNNGGLDTDGVIYASMAGMEGLDSRAARVAPWCYRVLTPWLASLLPLETIQAFKALGLVTNALCLVLVYLLLRHSGMSHRVALLGQLWYGGIFWTLKFSFYSPCYIDDQTQLFLLTVLLLLVLRRYWFVPAVLALGVLQKESLVALIPLAQVARTCDTGWRTRGSLTYALALVALPAASLFAVRSAVTPLNDFDLFGEWGIDLRPLVDAGFWPRFLLAVFSGLGMLPVVVAARGRRALALLRRNPLWLTLAVVSTAMLFGGMDKSRLFLYLAPVMIWLVSHLTREEVDHPDWRSAAWLGSALVLHFYLGNHLTPMGTFEEYLVRLVPIHAPGPLLPTVLRTAGVVAAWSAIALLTGFEQSRRSGRLPTS